jgi:chemotaxis protein MotB
MASQKEGGDMRRWISLGVGLGLLGCGVTKEVYQTEYMRAREVEAKNEDCAARLETETRRREGVEAEAARWKGDAGRLEGERKRLALLLADMQKERDDCLTVRESLSGDLDLARKTAHGADAEVEKLKRDLAAQKTAGRTLSGEWEAERNDLHGRIETARGKLAVVEAERDLLLEEKRRLESEKEEKIAEVSSTYDDLLESMKEEVEKGRVTISELQGQLSVELMNEILFPSGSAEVSEEGRGVLDRLGQALSPVTDKAILVEGHTDNVPIRGGLSERYPTNWDLSTARAVSIVRHLTEKAGIDPARIGAAGYGEFRPISPNDTPEGRARNRRIEIKLLPLPPLPPAPQAAQPQAEAEAAQPVPETVPAPETAPAPAGTDPAQNP